MIVSIIANRARVIEAFCEDGKIILRATRLYDFPKEIPVAVEHFTTWYHGYPTGDTTWIALGLCDQGTLVS